jgi:hypothetical protein
MRVGAIDERPEVGPLAPDAVAQRTLRPFQARISEAVDRARRDPRSTSSRLVRNRSPRLMTAPVGRDELEELGRIAEANAMRESSKIAPDRLG